MKRNFRNAVLATLFVLSFLTIGQIFAAQNLPPFDGQNLGSIDCSNSSGGWSTCYVFVPVNDISNYQAFWGMIDVIFDSYGSAPDSSTVIDFCLTETSTWGTGQAANCQQIYGTLQHVNQSNPPDVKITKAIPNSSLGNYSQMLRYAAFRIAVDDGRVFGAGFAEGRRVHIYNVTASPETVNSGETSQVCWTTENVPDGDLRVLKDGAGNILNQGGSIDACQTVTPTQTTTYTLFATGPGFESWFMTPITVEKSVTVNVTNPPPGLVNLNFFVKDQNTTPVSGALVTINQDFGNGTTRNTDGNGFANFGVGTNVSIGYTVSATNCTGASGTQNVGSSDATVNITLNCGGPPPAGTFNLTVNKSGSGTVTGSGISCGTDCSENFDQGTSVNLTAIPDSGWTFSGWSGDCGTNASNTLSCNMNSNKNVTATFTSTVVPPPTGCQGNCAQYISQSVPSQMTVSQSTGVSVTMRNTGTTTWTTSGYKLGSQNPQDNFTWGRARVDVPTTISPGQEATFNFNVTPPSVPGTYNFQWRMVEEFVQWFGDYTPNVSVNVVSAPVSTCQDTNATNYGSSLPCTHLLSVGKNGSGSGTVTSSPSGITCGSDCSEIYSSGTSVTLNASKDSDSDFKGWSGDVSCTGTGSCTVTMNGNKNVTATFDKKKDPTVTLFVYKNGSGSGTVTGGNGINCGNTCSASFNPGNMVSLNAVPNSGSTFAGWSSPCSGTGGCVFQINSDQNVTATFNATSPTCQDPNATNYGGPLPCTYPPGAEPVADSCTVNIVPSAVSISANPTSVTYGQSSTLNWSASSAGSCSASGDWSGSKNTSGSQPTGALTQIKRYSYTITCYGSGQPASNTAYVDVTASPPATSNVTVILPNYCFSGPAATVGWTYSDPLGSPQSAYQVQIDNQSSFNSPEVESGKVSCSNCRSYFSGTGILQFNTTYRARVRTWNAYDIASPWQEATICNGTDCQPNGSWKTPSHAYPNVNSPYQFTWSPANQTIDKPIQFTDRTLFDPQSNNKQWSWIFVPAGGGPGTSNSQNPAYTFEEEGTYQITESVRDNAMSSGEFCTGPTQPINVIKPIPIWKEVAPR